MGSGHAWQLIIVAVLERTKEKHKDKEGLEGILAIASVFSCSVVESN